MGVIYGLVKAGSDPTGKFVLGKGSWERVFPLDEAVHLGSTGPSVLAARIIPEVGAEVSGWVAAVRILHWSRGDVVLIHDDIDERRWDLPEEGSVFRDTN